MAKLVLHLPNGAMRDIPLDRDRITIGRRADNDLCLPYPAVSAEHAIVITVLTDSFLQDLESTNGTLVNGARVTKHFLIDHDQIDIGRVQMVYLTNDTATVDPLPPDMPRDEIRGVTETAPEVADATAVDTDPEQASESERAEAASENLAPVDDLLEDLMDMNCDASVAVDMPPTISVVPSARSRAGRAKEARRGPHAGVFVEVMNGPNAGQITPMTKREFVFGKAGITKAAIRRDGADYTLFPVDGDLTTLVNGQSIAPDGARLAFGDTIEVAGVKLRFDRRVPL